MKIDAIDEKSVLVELSKEDLSKSEITYEELDYANERTRTFVRKYKIPAQRSAWRQKLQEPHQCVSLETY